jgi:beta-lactam-binding protein with PASTA domain
LSAKGLYPQVIDSVNVRNKKLGTIVDQIPPANSSVKSNRLIFLIINSRKVHQVVLPEIDDVSYRQADAMLQSVGLSVASVVYAPSDYKDLVISVKFHGNTVYPGTRIPEGSALILVVGNGKGITENKVPALKGIRLDEAIDEINSASFSLGSIIYDVPPSGDEDSYIIYRQHPAAGSYLPEGGSIDVYLSKDKSRVNEVFEEDKKQETDEQFF